MGKITITGLSIETNEDDLRKAFVKFGEIKEIKIPVDKTTNKPKGLGFIIFKTDEGSSNASAEMDGTDLNGEEITVNIALGK